MAEFTKDELLKRVNSSYSRPGNPRVREISERMISDIFKVIEDLDISHAELWAFNRWMNQVGAANEVGLLGAGVGLERLLDLIQDEKDEKEHREKGTPRAIEGPLYVPGAPLVKGGYARIDDGTEEGEIVVMEGNVLDVDGNPVPGAIVEVWHCNQQGTYSIIDPTQSPYNMRRKIETDEKGHYCFRSLLPPGYAVAPDSPTRKYLDWVGRHGRRPAHIHFMVTSPGCVPLTTQVNLPGDPYLNDDFAFATRDDLVVSPEKVTDPKLRSKYQIEKPFTRIEFDFVLQSQVQERGKSAA